MRISDRVNGRVIKMILTAYIIFLVAVLIGVGCYAHFSQSPNSEILFIIAYVAISNLCGASILRIIVGQIV